MLIPSYPNPSTQTEIAAAGLEASLTRQVRELERMVNVCKMFLGRISGQGSIMYPAIAAFRTDFPTNHMFDTLGKYLDYDDAARSGHIAANGRFILPNQVEGGVRHWGLDIILFRYETDAQEAFQHLPHPQTWVGLRLGKPPCSVGEGYPFLLTLTHSAD